MSQVDEGPAGDDERPDDGSEIYGVFGEGRPRRIVGESDEPPRRRPRKKPGDGTDRADPADR